jgi:hypothetical protein
MAMSPNETTENPDRFRFALHRDPIHKLQPERISYQIAAFANEQVATVLFVSPLEAGSHIDSVSDHGRFLFRDEPMLPKIITKEAAPHPKFEGRDSSSRRSNGEDFPS